jgi:SEC-C motif
MDYDTHVAHLKMSEGVFVEFDIQLLNEHTVYDIRMTDNEVFRGVILRGTFLYKIQEGTVYELRNKFIEAVTVSAEIVDIEVFETHFAFFKKWRENNERPLSMVEIKPRELISEPLFYQGTTHGDRRKRQSVEVRTEPKIGRNEPCQCGSGQKSKKCCNA